MLLQTRVLKPATGKLVLTGKGRENEPDSGCDVKLMTECYSAR